MRNTLPQRAARSTSNPNPLINQQKHDPLYVQALLRIQQTLEARQLKDTAVSVRTGIVYASDEKQATPKRSHLRIVSLPKIQRRKQGQQIDTKYTLFLVNLPW